MIGWFGVQANRSPEASVTRTIASGRRLIVATTRRITRSPVFSS
jgi:hypothetical protein